MAFVIGSKVYRPQTDADPDPKLPGCVPVATCTSAEVANRVATALNLTAKVEELRELIAIETFVGPGPLMLDRGESTLTLNVRHSVPRTSYVLTLTAHALAVHVKALLRSAGIENKLSVPDGSSEVIVHFMWPKAAERARALIAADTTLTTRIAAVMSAVEV